MKKDRSFLRHPGCLLALAGLFSLFATVSWRIKNALTTYYTHVDILRLPSPTGAWTAILFEDIVEGPISTNITAGVSLLSTEHATVPISLLGIDNYGDTEILPKIAWSAPNVLSVFLLRAPSLKVLTRHADGVDVEIHVDPSDAAAKAAYFKQLERTHD